ncbi:MAG: hypothetical protein H6730_35645 [Deltaproteobacteria bacterium]|nr:hypothetical protein [Deltaproteobacteria bacterium]
MLADGVVVLVLVVVGALLQHFLRGAFFPAPPPRGLTVQVLRQPWLALVALAFLISLGGWVGRALVVGLPATLKTAGGGPTEWEFETCHKLLPELGRCPYGGVVELVPDPGRPEGSAQAHLRCSLHGDAQ